MMRCLNCGKVVEQAGNRPRLYCDDRCRMAYKRLSEQSYPNTLSGQALIERNHPMARPDIADYGEPDCECMHCKSNRANGGKHTINHGEYKPVHLLGKGEFNRVTLPGDPDYDGVCLAEKYKSRKTGF